MRHNRSVDTGPEVTLRKALWAARLRGYRKNVAKLPGKPDLVFGRARLAVFVHGCFWHQCPHCKRNRTPKANSAYWQRKFERNAERDRLNSEALEAMGYRVLVVWECQIRDDLGSVVRTVAEELAALSVG